VDVLLCTYLCNEIKNWICMHILMY
jgi:hypothetical protein